MAYRSLTFPSIVMGLFSVFGLFRIHASEQAAKPLPFILRSTCIVNAPFYLSGMLLEQGEEWKQAKDYRHALLIQACYSRDSGLIEFLLKHGADLDYIGAGGDTALSIACKRMSDRIIETFLQHGADASQVDVDGDTLLYNACFARDEKRAELLSRYGAYILTEVQISEFPDEVKLLAQRCNDLIIKRRKLLYELLDEQESLFVQNYFMPEVIKKLIISDMLGHK